MIDGILCKWIETPAGRSVAVCGDGRDKDLVASLLEKDSQSPDLFMIDPPYNLSAQSKRIKFSDRRAMVGSDREWDREVSEEEFFPKILGPLLDVGIGIDAHVLAVWTSDWWLSQVKLHLRAAGYRVWPTYHWCKTNPAFPVRKANPTSAVEYLAIASRPKSFFDLAALDGHKNWVARPVVSQTERLKVPDPEDPTKVVDVNPTQKPLDLTRILIKALCPPGGLVLDTCGGTGTTAVAASLEGRRFAYVEIDPVQFAAAGRRFRSGITLGGCAV